MGMVIVAMAREAHQARGLIRALDDAGFSGEDIDLAGTVLADLVARGVPTEEADAFAEGVRRGGAIVCVRTDDIVEAAEAAHLMSEHGAPGHIYLDARTVSARYSGPERRVRDQPYPGTNRRAT
jgi:hypothetical protein